MPAPCHRILRKITRKFEVQASAGALEALSSEASEHQNRTQVYTRMSNLMIAVRQGRPGLKPVVWRRLDAAIKRRSSTAGHAADMGEKGGGKGRETGDVEAGDNPGSIYFGRGTVPETKGLP